MYFRRSRAADLRGVGDGVRHPSRPTPACHDRDDAREDVCVRPGGTSSKKSPVTVHHRRFLQVDGDLPEEALQLRVCLRDEPGGARTSASGDRVGDEGEAGAVG
jgi:hypothetical protein